MWNKVKKVFSVIFQALIDARMARVQQELDIYRQVHLSHKK